MEFHSKSKHKAKGVIMEYSDNQIFSILKDVSVKNAFQKSRFE